MSMRATREIESAPSFGSNWLVVGCTGFIGRWLVRVLPGCRGLSGRDCPVTPANRERVRRRLSEGGLPSVVVHAAGAVGDRDPNRLEKALLQSTSTLIELLAETAPSTRLILIGSAAEIAAERRKERNAGTYGGMKLQQTSLAREMASASGVPLTVLRLHNTLGPGQSTSLVAASMIERLRACLESNTGKLLVRNPRAIRDYLDIRDVARCIVAVGTSDRNDWRGRIVELCSGQGRSVAALAGELLAAAGVAVPLRCESSEVDTPDEFVGNPAYLQYLLDHKPIQTISSFQSLQDMWRDQIHPS